MMFLIVVILEALLSLVVFYAAGATLFCLVRRKSIWEEAKYDKARRKKSLRNWVLLAIASLILIPRQIQVLISIWTKLMN